MTPHSRRCTLTVLQRSAGVGILLLAGCDADPLTTTVKKHQPGYEPPESFTVQGYRVPDSNQYCGHERGNPHIYGCLLTPKKGSYKIYYSTDSTVLAHEFEHIAYGPAHN